MNNLVLIRSPSGYGKSTLARNEFVPKGYKHFETDNYFMVDGIYKFDASKIRQAHAFTQNHVYESMKYGFDVVVSNTFTKLWEMEFYLNAAKFFNYNVRVIRMTKKYQNTHGVPESAVKAMEDRMEDYRGEDLY